MTPRPPAPALTAAEQARVARFDAAPVPVEGWEQRVEAAARAVDAELARRCSTCLRPSATEHDWERYGEGEGDHLCWESGNCCIDPGNDLARVAAAAALTADAALAGQHTADEEADRG